MPDPMHGILYFVRVPSEPINVPLRRKLFRVVGGFKSSVTSAVRFRLSDAEFEVWQKRFNDRIIRNDAELEQIREYIRANPFVWSAPEME